MKIKNYLNFWGVLSEIPFNKGVNSFGIFGFAVLFLIFNISAILNRDIIAIIFIIEVLLIGIILRGYSGIWFDKIWKFNNRFVEKNWDKLGRGRFTWIHIQVFFGPCLLAVFHLLQGFLLRSENIILSRQQSSIGFVFLVLFLWFVSRGRETLDNKKQVAFSFFLMALSIVLFDGVLAQIQYFSGNIAWINTIQVPIFILIFGIMEFLFPDILGLMLKRNKL